MHGCASKTHSTSQARFIELSLSVLQHSPTFPWKLLIIILSTKITGRLTGFGMKTLIIGTLSHMHWFLLLTFKLFTYFVVSVKFISFSLQSFQLKKVVYFWYSWEMNQQFNVGYYDSSSLDGNTQTIASKNIVSERSRRQKLSDKLLALREAVPKISKVFH